MSDLYHRSGYGAGARIAGWVTAAFWAGNQILTGWMPRTSKELALRAELREWHMWIGLSLFLAAGVRLYFWFREGRVAPAPGVPRAVHAQARVLAFTAYLSIFVSGLFGFGYAWGSGYAPPILGQIVAQDYTMWNVSGYFHSAFSFVMTLMALAVAVLSAYIVYRYRVGFMQAFPEPFALQAYVGLCITGYTLINTGSSRGPGLEVFVVVGLLVWAGGWWLRRSQRGRAAAGVNHG